MLKCEYKDDPNRFINKGCLMNCATCGLAFKKAEPAGSSSTTETMGAEYERKNGSVALLKAGFSAVSRLLCEKGIITEDEILTAFENEVKRRS